MTSGTRGTVAGSARRAVKTVICIFLTGLREQDGSRIYRTKNGFRYPLSKDRQGKYKVKSGEMIRVCMTSDFFLEEADEWRDEAWSVMRERKDVKFFLLTKRPERVLFLSAL